MERKHHVGAGASITKHKQVTTSFRKLQKQMVEFFTKQFDQMHKDKTEAITRGFISDCDTIYVLGFDNTNHYHIIAAIQYVALSELYNR